jgi:hypothetical protein
MQNLIVHCAKSRDEVYREIYNRSHEGTYVSYLRGSRCLTEDDFFYEVSASFQFPYYFGENWAAFDECICDLEWLSFNSLFIVVDDFERMFNGNRTIQNQFKEYMKIMVDYWEEQGVFVEVWLN